MKREFTLLIFLFLLLKPGQIISYWYERDTGKKHTSINGVEQK